MRLSAIKIEIMILDGPKRRAASKMFKPCLNRGSTNKALSFLKTLS